MKIEFSSQRREMLLFLTTNIAAVTSPANQYCVFFSSFLQFWSGHVHSMVAVFVFLPAGVNPYFSTDHGTLNCFLEFFTSYDGGFLPSGEKPEVLITRASFLDKETFACVCDKKTEHVLSSLWLMYLKTEQAIPK